MAFIRHYFNGKKPVFGLFAGDDMKSTCWDVGTADVPWCRPLG